ncbi:MAG: glycosyltransferase family 2 protein [Chloroflexi bacterium]|nr:glycosyltransferase family 2 protein [Chloroflexota bacterium]
MVLTKDEERHLPDCLKSLAWADEVLVFDSFSGDRTVEIARQMGARVAQRRFVDYPRQRQAALEAAGGDWVFFVDADERVTPELAAEIGEVILQPTPVGWWVPRRNIIVGRWIRHTGWYPDYQLRLMRPNRARYDLSRQVHELVVLEGEEGHLRSEMVHYNYDTWGEFVRKQSRYARFDARILWREGVRPRPWKFVTQPLREFRRRYLTLQGYRDGLHGLLLSLLMAYYQVLVYTQLGRVQEE